MPEQISQQPNTGKKIEFAKSPEFQEYQKVQSIAKETIEFLESFIKQGMTEKEIREAAESFLHKKGISSFWYYDIGAFVFTGERTTKSISGREYQPTDEKVQSEDLVTVDLSPEIRGIWGDFARSFVIADGKVAKAEQSNSPEIIQGIKAEEMLHKRFQEFLREDMSFEEACAEMNLFIKSFGFENLDFKGNLGHSIERNLKDRIYIEPGNKTKFKEVNLFTFEPHIRKKDGRYGFKREDVYYFSEGKLQIL